MLAKSPLQSAEFACGALHFSTLSAASQTIFAHRADAAMRGNGSTILLQLNLNVGKPSQGNLINNPTMVDPRFKSR